MTTWHFRRSHFSPTSAPFAEPRCAQHVSASPFADRRYTLREQPLRRPTGGERQNSTSSVARHQSSHSECVMTSLACRILASALSLLSASDLSVSAEHPAAACHTDRGKHATPRPTPSSTWTLHGMKGAGLGVATHMANRALRSHFRCWAGCRLLRDSRIFLDGDGGCWAWKLRRLLPDVPIETQTLPCVWAQ